MSFTNNKYSREDINKNLQEIFSSFKSFDQDNDPRYSPHRSPHDKSRYWDHQQRMEQSHGHSPSEHGSPWHNNDSDLHVNATNLMNKSGPSSPHREEIWKTDARLAAIAKAKQVFKDEQATKEENLKRLEYEERMLIEWKKKALQEQEDRRYAKQLQR